MANDTEVETLEMRLARHIERTRLYESKVDQIVKLQESFVQSMERQSAQMVRLNECIESLSTNIDRGLHVIFTGARLFRLVIFAFISVIGILGATIVYITNVDVDVFHGKISSNKNERQHNEQQSENKGFNERLDAIEKAMDKK